MIIDFHTHTFPQQLAKRALEKLGGSEGLKPCTDGTNSGLIESMDRSGVDVSILLPVVTKVVQTEDINKIAASAEALSEHRLISFGGIHPDDEKYEEHLKELVRNGVKGIKLHPVFQQTYFDDIRYMHIVDKASEMGLIIMVHAGSDISMPDAKYSSAEHLIRVANEVRPNKLIYAHMGSWRDWDDAERVISECHDIYIDTSFVLPIDGRETFYDTGIPAMPTERFCKIVKAIGADRVLFGTDSPWVDQRQSIDIIKNSGLMQEEVDKILGGNAKELLKI